MLLTVLLTVDSRRSGWMSTHTHTHTITRTAHTCIVNYMHTVHFFNNYIPWRDLSSTARKSRGMAMWCFFCFFCFFTSNQTIECWFVSSHLVSLGVTLWNTKSKCQPSHHHDSPVFCVPAALQGADDRFARVNPCDLRGGLAGARAHAGEAADLFHRGRDEVGQQGHCDPWKEKCSMLCWQ